MDRVHVSKMSGKLKGFRAVNFNPLTSDFCKKMHLIPGSVCEMCYSSKMIGTYRASCAKPFTANAELMKGALLTEQLVCFDPGEHVRLLAHGDMDTEEQFRNMLRIVLLSPASFFTMWTKRIDIVQSVLANKNVLRKALSIDKLPDNLKLIQSSRNIGQADALAKGFHAVFTVYDSEEKVPMTNTTRCWGKSCADCMYCYKQPKGNISELLRR